MLRTGSLILVICATILLLFWTRPDTQAELQPLPPTRISTDLVQVMDLQPVTVFTGKLQPIRKSVLQFEVSGRIIERVIEPGQKVTTGDVLLKIFDGDFRDNVEEAEALYILEIKAIDRDRKLLELLVDEREILEREVDRLDRLGQESLSSKSNFDQALQRLLQRRADESRLRHSVDTANSRIKTSLAALNRAKRNLERATLAAPFDGTINSVQVDEGDYVTSGQIAVEIVQLDALDLYLEITGSVAHQLGLGQVVNVFIDEKEFQGEIIALSPDPDPDTHTHALRIRVSGKDIYAGQLALAELPEKILKNVNVVPLSAILRDEGQSFIFRVEKNRIYRQPVKLTYRYQQWQVIENIEPGTRIVDRDVSVLADGQEVSVE